MLDVACLKSGCIGNVHTLSTLGTMVNILEIIEVSSNMSIVQGVTVDQIIEWILRNTKVSELEEMTISTLGPEDMLLHILGSKIEELNRRERERDD